MRFQSSILAIVVVLLFSIACVQADKIGPPMHADGDLGPEPVAQNDEIESLTIALYPYVPTADWTRRVLRREWAKLHPSVELKFVTDWSWDGGYKTLPDESYDIFEVDNLALSHMVDRGYCAEIDYAKLNNSDQLYEFATKGCTVEGKYYGLPRLVCGPLIFYRADDPDAEQIEGAKSLADLFAIIGNRSDPDVTPELGEGLVTNELNSGTNCVAFYLDSQMDASGSYSSEPQMPDLKQFDQAALSNVSKLVKMAGLNHSKFENWEGLQARWFANGRGQVMVGWSERAHHISPQVLSEMSVRTLPMASSNDVNLFYVDSLAVRKKAMSGEKLKLIHEFLNMCNDSAVVHDCMVPRGKNPTYLLSANKHAMDALSRDKDSAFYAKLRPLLESSNQPRTFRLPAGGIEWLYGNEGANKDAFLKEVYSRSVD